MYFKQQTLTLKKPTDSQALAFIFEKQQEKVEVLRNEILKIQQFMDISSNNLLPI